MILSGKRGLVQEAAAHRQPVEIIPPVLACPSADAVSCRSVITSVINTLLRRQSSGCQLKIRSMTK
jgi:hypothetical protein